METLTLKLRGMSCASCAKSIEKAINNVPGVTNCNVNFGIEQATITYNPKKTNLDKIQAAVAEAGYSSSPQEDITSGDDETETAARLAELNQLQRKVMVGAVISTILVIGSLPAMTGLHISLIPAWLHNSWLQLVLTAPVQFWCGKAFYIGTWKA